MSLLLLLNEDAREALTPTLDDVAALLRARTYDANGVQVGQFTGSTRPSAAHVQELIDFAAGDVLARAGVGIAEQYWPEARRLAALRAAALVESSFFPEQLDSDRSAYKEYTAAYLDGIRALVELVRQPSAIRLV
jgi:hypothetical protein